MSAHSDLAKALAEKDEPIRLGRVEVMSVQGARCTIRLNGVDPQIPGVSWVGRAAPAVGFHDALISGVRVVVLVAG